MNIKPDALPKSLQRGLAPVYLIAGAEPLLVQEARDQVIAAARAQGFLERDIYPVDRSFSWKNIAADAMEQSLFSSRKIMDIRLPTGKPGTEGAKYLVEQAEAADPDTMLMVSCGAWDAATRKSKWASKLGSAGVLVEIWPVKPHELPRWIEQRLRALGLRAEREAVSLLAELVEGNLLAAQQEIDKLALLNTGDVIGPELVRHAVGNSSRFDTFRLGECMLGGRAADCLRVAAGLQRTGIAIQAVAGSLYYQLNQLHAVCAALRNGENEAQVFGRLRIFRAQQALYRQAARRLSVARINRAFSAMSRLDRQSKGRAAGDPWQTLDQVMLLLAAETSAAGRVNAG